MLQEQAELQVCMKGGKPGMERFTFMAIPFWCKSNTSKYRGQVKETSENCLQSRETAFQSLPLPADTKERDQYCKIDNENEEKHTISTLKHFIQSS